jgi:hypothetical protein
MNIPSTTTIELDPKTEKKIKNLKKSLEQIVIFTLIGCIIPLLWPFMIAFGPVYALQRRSILKIPRVREWLSENPSVNLKDLAAYPTVEGGIARIKISGFRPWIPVVLPVIACVVMIVLSQFV